MSNAGNCPELHEHSRSGTRIDASGDLVQLAQQDRGGWNVALIREGQELVRRCLEINRPGPYQIQAAINALHNDASSIDETDWVQIVALYDQLLVIHAGPVVVLNRAVAVAENRRPQCCPRSHPRSASVELLRVPCRACRLVAPNRQEA